MRPLFVVLAVASCLAAMPSGTARAQSACSGDGSPADRACRGLADAEAGRWAEAEAQLATALDFAGDPEVSARRAEIDEALARARAHLGSLDVRCAPAGSVITIDGTPRGLAPLLRPLRLVAGTYLAGCTREEHHPASQSVTVTAGALASVSLALAPIDRRPVLERIGAPGEAQRVVGIVALSLGGVSLAVGLGTLFAGLDAAPADREPFFDVARGTLIAAGALAVVGLVLFVTA
ncbi:MAG: hypothetical protein OHK0013_39270 [Sandaracinaceae bacterium]